MHILDISFTNLLLTPPVHRPSNQLKELYREGINLNATHKNKQHEHPGSILWFALLVIAITSLVLDAAALAWSAAVQDGHLIMAEVFTFLVVLTGTLITVWKMRAN